MNFLVVFIYISLEMIFLISLLIIGFVRIDMIIGDCCLKVVLIIIIMNGFCGRKFCCLGRIVKK